MEQVHTSILTMHHDTGTIAARLLVVNEGEMLKLYFCDYDAHVYNICMTIGCGSQKIELSNAINYLFRPEVPCKPENIVISEGGSIYFEGWGLNFRKTKHNCEEADESLKKHRVFERFETADEAIEAWNKMPDDVLGVGQDLYQCNIVKWLWSVVE